MSSGPWETECPTHFPLPIRADGEGPETNPELVVRTICWSCLPDEDWPCRGFTEEVNETAKKLGIEL